MSKARRKLWGSREYHAQDDMCKEKVIKYTKEVDCSDVKRVKQLNAGFTIAIRYHNASGKVHKQVLSVLKKEWDGIK